MTISYSTFNRKIKNWIFLKSTQNWLLKDVQYGISRPLGSREIQQTKVATVLRDTLYIICALPYFLLHFFHFVFYFFFVFLSASHFVLVVICLINQEGISIHLQCAPQNYTAKLRYKSAPQKCFAGKLILKYGSSKYVVMLFK